MGSQLEKATKPISGWPEWTPLQQKVEDTFRERISRVFQSWGYEPLKTRAVERKEALLVKGEITKQVYEVKQRMADESALFLRFDLTLPLARYVAQNRNFLPFPFRRYQIQKVWRGERAQKGRFREFLQCDVDVIGRSRLPIEFDAEVIAVLVEALLSLFRGEPCIQARSDNPFTVHVSNRKILFGLFDHFKLSQKERDEILTALDRMEKKADGVMAVRKLLEEKMLPLAGKELTEVILDLLLDKSRSSEEKLELIRAIPISSDEWTSGVKEIHKLFQILEGFGVSRYVKFDVSIVRGLDYYTATVFETFLTDRREFGSICSGGRYDALVSTFAMTDEPYPGVGGSIGLTRLLSYCFEENLISQISSSTDVVIALDDVLECLRWRKHLAKYGVISEILPASVMSEKSSKSLKKLLKFCEKKAVRFLLFQGEFEKDQKLISLYDISKSKAKKYAVIDDDIYSMLAREILSKVG